MNEYILLRPFRLPICGCLGIAPVPAKLDLNRPRSKWPSRNPKERLGVFANETTSRRFPGCGSGFVSRIRTFLQSDGSQLGAEYRIRCWCTGDVPECRIQMYSGPHLTGWLGAAQCAGPMAAGKWQSYSNSDAHGYPHSNSHGNTDPDSSAWGWRHMRSGMESQPCLLQYFHHYLQWRKQGEQEWLELYCAILEPGSGSDGCRQCRSCRLRRSVVYRRCLLHGHTDAHSNSDSYAQTHADANSASAGQRDLRGI